VKIGLAKDDGAGFLECLNSGRIDGRLRLSHVCVGTCRGHERRVEVIFQQNWNSEERAKSSIVRSESPIAGIGVIESVGVERQDGIGMIIESFDTGQERFHDFATGHQASVEIMMSGGDGRFPWIKCC
jgi:hypothetical protein